MKNTAITLLLLLTTVCLGTTVFAVPPPRHGGHGRITAKEANTTRDANEKTKRKLASCLTDEGSSGRLSWKEYTANPKAKGETTLLVVFGGRDSVKDGRGEAKIPVAIEKAISHASMLPKSGRLIVLVPDMTVGERRRGRGGRETPGRMKLETLKKTGHAESESVAYSKNDAWKWLFR